MGTISQERRLIIGAEDLLHDIERHDAERTRVGWSRSDRGSAAVMRRIGLSDDEIVERLGYNPLASEVFDSRETAFALRR